MKNNNQTKETELELEKKKKEEEIERTIEEWMNSKRFQGLKRSYTSKTISQKRGSLPINKETYTNIQSRNLINLIKESKENLNPILTIGTLDPVQQTQISQHLPVIYVSGWSCSSNFVPDTFEIGPDLADYPYHTVPTLVKRLVKAQELHDKKEWDLNYNNNSKEKKINYFKPIIADGDNGHGGISTIMKLAKLFGESGTSAVHFEDQLIGGKKCGHQSGKVLVPISEHIQRLKAVRFQWDLMFLESLIIARTDSISAKLISSDIDFRDHPFILGVLSNNNNNNDILPLADLILNAEISGATFDQINQIETSWLNSVELITFDEAVERTFKENQIKESQYNEYKNQVKTKNLTYTKSKELAEKILKQEGIKKESFKINWSSKLPRTKEGYYRFNGGLNAAIFRANCFAPFSDLLWVETQSPNLIHAKFISNSILNKFPDKGLVYNLSPSFNWSNHGFSDLDLKNFSKELCKLGYIIQIISLAGIHSTATITAKLAKDIKERGMLGYVESIQRVEKEIGCDVLKHQKWSGSEYIDSILNIVSAGSTSTSASGDSSTEKTF